MHWMEWNPGLNNDTLTLREVYDSLPGYSQSDINWLVRALENPKSPFALTGAIDLFGHDCVHVLLGRGLLAQDEAFVIGFTMGTSKRLSSWQRNFFKFATQHLYPKEYRFDDNDLKVFDLGVECGIKSPCKEIYKIDFRPLLDLPLGEVRARVGIDKQLLLEAYEIERWFVPQSPVSRRLPVRHISNKSASSEPASPTTVRDGLSVGIG